MSQPSLVPFLTFRRSGAGDRSEQRRHAAVLVLKELAEHAPTLFNVHVSSFLDHVWVALRDPKLAIRDAAVLALRACLTLISKRASRWRLQWYYKIFGEAQKGFKLSTSESVHGSLLTIGELLRNSGEFMLARFKEVCDTVLKYRDHKDRLVRSFFFLRSSFFVPRFFLRFLAHSGTS